MKIWLVYSMQRLTRDSAMQQPITLGKSSSTLIPRSTFALSSLGAFCRECRHHASSIHRRDGSCQISETERVSLSSNRAQSTLRLFASASNGAAASGWFFSRMKIYVRNARRFCWKFMWLALGASILCEVIVATYRHLVLILKIKCWLSLNL